MFSKRQNQISNLIRKELSELFLLKSNEWLSKKMITVTTVRITKDLSIANVFLSIFPSEDSAESIELLNNNVGKIRFELGKRVRHQLKIIPELRFHLDDSLDYIEKIEQALKK